MKKTTKEITIKGKKYKFQFPGVRWCLKHTDNSTIKGQLNQEKYIDGLLENVVIEGAKNIDEFESLEELQEVTGAIEEFIKK